MLAEKRVSAEPASKQELDELRAMAATNLSDAGVQAVSAQGRYEFAYNAARLLATVVVRACGYRVISKTGHHYYTFQAMQAADSSFAKLAGYFDTARETRNDFSYDTPVLISDTDADDLANAVRQFQQDTEAWIKKRYPTLS